MDYIDVLGKKFPNVRACCIGDPSIYENLVWDSGDVLPSKVDLDAAAALSIREDMWGQIKLERDRRKFGGVQVAGSWFHSDDTSRIQQIGLVMLGTNIPAGLLWKTMTGSFVIMTQQLAGGIFQTIAVSDTSIFKVAEQHRSAMEASSDPQNYNFSAGWPAIYGE